MTCPGLRHPLPRLRRKLGGSPRLCEHSRRDLTHRECSAHTRLYERHNRTVRGSAEDKEKCREVQSEPLVLSVLSFACLFVCLFARGTRFISFRGTRRRSAPPLPGVPRAQARPAAAMGGRVTRVFRNFNVENRARREISKEKPTAAPRHRTARLDAMAGERRPRPPSGSRCGTGDIESGAGRAGHAGSRCGAAVGDRGDYSGQQREGG